jgi:hypothetical protein
VRLYLLGGDSGSGRLGWEQQLLENLEGVGAVAASSDLEGGGAEFGVFLGEVGDAGGCQGGLFTLVVLGGEEGGMRGEGLA